MIRQDTALLFVGQMSSLPHSTCKPPASPLMVRGGHIGVDVIVIICQWHHIKFCIITLEPVTEVIFTKLIFNPIALRMAKTLWSFYRSECSRVKTQQSKILSNSTDTYFPMFSYECLLQGEGVVRWCNGPG